MVKSVVTGDFESDNNFNLKALEHEDDTACDEWNAESTLKFKEVVVRRASISSGNQQGQMPPTFKEKPFAEWLALRTFALRHQLP